jgi:nucleoside 2-deoxyribosyltransferase
MRVTATTTPNARRGSGTAPAERHVGLASRRGAVPHPGRDTAAVRISFAGPLFTAAERAWNATLAAALREAGHEVFLPQEQEPAADAEGIFATDVHGIDRSDAVVAIMDGADPDSGTSWEVGYAYGKKPIMLVRTDLRGGDAGVSADNAMLSEAATIRVDLVGATSERLARDVIAAVARLGSP